jgi:hypothetical protein
VESSPRPSLGKKSHFFDLNFLENRIDNLPSKSIKITPISRFLGTSFSVHDSLQSKSACFWVSVDIMHFIVGPVKFNGGLFISILRNKQLFYKS